MTVIGTLFSALTVNLRLRELMLPTLVYPLMIPALMAAITVTTNVLAGSPPGLGVRASSGVRYHLYVAGRGFCRYCSSRMKNMREKIIIGLAIFAGALLAWNMNTIFTVLPDRAEPGRHLPDHLFPRPGQHSGHARFRSGAAVQRRIPGHQGPAL